MTHRARSAARAYLAVHLRTHHVDLSLQGRTRILDAVLEASDASTPIEKFDTDARRLAEGGTRIVYSRSWLSVASDLGVSRTEAKRRLGSRKP